MSLSQESVENLKQRLQKISSAHELSWILEWLSKFPNSDDTNARAEDLIRRRENGEPLAYIFGEWAFRDLELFVGPGVLIPRPETEELVDLALNLGSWESGGKFRIADLGAGTGAIGLGLLKGLQNRRREPALITLDFIEASPDAYRYLQQNVARYRTLFTRARMETHQLPWDEWALYQDEKSFDFLISNPPYISQDEWQNLDPGVKNYEPQSALVPRNADEKAMSDYLQIVEIAARLLKEGGLLLFEMGLQSDDLLGHMEGDRRFCDLSLSPDMAGKARFLSARRSKD